MKIGSRNLGEHRWNLTLISNSYEEDVEFKEWMDKHCSECMYVKRFNNGEPYWEVRGGDMRLQTMIILRWSK